MAFPWRLAAPVSSRGYKWVNPDVFPLVVILSGATTFATLFGMRALYASPDVMCAAACTLLHHYLRKKSSDGPMSAAAAVSITASLGSAAVATRFAICCCCAADKAASSARCDWWR